MARVFSLLSNRGILLKHRSRVYNTCIRPAMLYGAETSALTQREESLLQGCDRRKFRGLYGVNLRYRGFCAEALSRCGILHRIRKMRMTRFGHVYRRDGNDPSCRVREVGSQGRRPRIVCEVIFQLPDSVRLQQTKKLDRRPSFHV